MRRRPQLLAVLALTLLAATALTACSQNSTTTQPAKEQIQQQTQQKQQAVDDALNSAQAKVKELAAAVGGLEARISGLQVSSDLQEIQRKLTAAIGEAGDKKVAAIDQLSSSFDNLIAKVDTAAAKLPSGGPVRTELEGFSAKLKDVQKSLADAAASYETSSTTSP